MGRPDGADKTILHGTIATQLYMSLILLGPSINLFSRQHHSNGNNLRISLYHYHICVSMFA